MMSVNKRNLTEKEEYYKLITDEKSNHIETNANGAGSQCVRRKNIGILSFRERYLSLRNNTENQQVTNLHPDLHPLLVNLGVILHPLFGAPLMDDMLKVLKF